MRQILLGLAFALLLATLTAAQGPVVLMEQGFDMLSGSVLTGTQVQRVDLRPLFANAEIVPIPGRYLGQKLFLMAAGDEPLDLIVDHARAMREYAMGGLLKPWGAYDQVREVLQPFKDVLVMLNGKVYGVGLDGRSGTGYAIGITRHHSLPDDVIQVFLGQILTAITPAPSSPVSQVRTSAMRFFDEFFRNQDFGTAYTYVHRNRKEASSPLTWTEVTFREYGVFNYYSRLEIGSVSVRYVEPLAIWENPYDGLTYADVMEVDVELTQRTRDGAIPHLLRTHWQQVDGEWLVLVSPHGFE